MAALERQAKAPAGFVAASTGPEGSKVAAASSGGAVQEVQRNEDEIDLGDIGFHQ